MWKTVFSVLFFYITVLSTPGDARVYTIRSNDCAVTATLPLVVSGPNVVAVDLNAGRATAQNVLIIYDRRYDGWASQRLFSRFVLDTASETPVTELDIDVNLTGKLCGAGAGHADKVQ